jgi:hypothetical protein
MAPLIKRPNSAVSRPVVEAVLRRLMQQPTDVRLRIAMRAIDEYAATLHTDRVYQHAQKVVDRVLLEAAEAKRSGDEFLPDPEIKNLPVMNFCGNCEWDKKFFVDGKKFLIATFSEKEFKIDSSQDASPTCQTCAECPNCRKPVVSTQTVRAPMECDMAPDDPCADSPCAEGSDTDAGTPPVGTDPVKVCSLCGESLPLPSFTRNRARPDGHASACRSCEIGRKALRRAAKRDTAPHP